MIGASEATPIDDDMSMPMIDPIANARTPLDVVVDLFKDLVPDNLFAAAANAQILGLIVFSLVVGFVLPRLGEQTAEPLVKLIESTLQLTMAMIGLLMYVVPVGIASLVAAKLGEDDKLVSKLERLALFVITVLLGLLGQMLLSLLYYFIVLRRNPFTFARAMLPAIIVAAGTGSSAATLPVTLQCCEKAGIDQKVFFLIFSFFFFFFLFFFFLVAKSQL